MVNWVRILTIWTRDVMHFHMKDAQGRSLGDRGMRHKTTSKLRILRYIFTVGFIVLAVKVLMPKVSSFKEIESVLRSMPLWLVGLAMISQIGSYIGSGYMLKSVMEEQKLQMSIGRGILVTMASASVGLVVGGTVGSAAATYHWASRSDNDRGKAIMAALLPTLYNAVILTFITVIGIAYLVFNHELSRIQVIAYGSALAIIIVAILLVVFGLKNHEKLGRVILKIAAKLNTRRKQKYDLHELESNISAFSNGVMRLRKKGLVKMGIGSFANILFDMLTLYIFFVASGHMVKPSVLIAGYTLAFLLTRAAIIVPGGVGITESSMAAVFASLGVQNHITIIVVIGYRLASFWFPSLIGFAAIPYLNKTSRVDV